MSQVTLFEHIRETKKPHHVEVRDVLHWIKTGARKEQIEEIRTLPTKKERDPLKEKLPCVCFSGKFTHRANAGIEKNGHSGIIALDFDHLGGRLDDFKTGLKNDKYVLAAFVSPSGDGLKVLIKIPACVDTHEQSSKALVEYFQDASLDDFKDVARVCYLSYDPELFYNPHSEVFTQLSTNGQGPHSVYEVTDSNEDPERIVDKIIKELDRKGEVYAKGNRHKYLTKVTGFCNACGVPPLTTTSIMVRRFEVVEGDPVPPHNIEKIVTDIYANYGHQYKTASASGEGRIFWRATGEEVEDIEISSKDFIFVENIWPEMLVEYRTGKSQGETTHMVGVDQHFRWSRGELNIMHGIGNHGKSAFLMHLCLIKSVMEGTKWAVFSPEQYPATDWYDDLIHAYWGQNTQFGFADRVSEDVYKLGADFMGKHFIYIYPEGESPTPDYINRLFEIAIKDHGVDGCIIDPYNQLDNDISKAGGREDLYLSRFLTKQKRFAVKHQVYMTIVTHPKNLSDKRRDENNNIIDPPEVFDLSGGAQWNNKADNIIFAHRPCFKNKDESRLITTFGSQKIKKQPRNGVPGEITLKFDPYSFRFLEPGHLHPLQGKIKTPGALFEEEDELKRIMREL